MSPSPGPAVRKAVIPIAGLGTRQFPASHAVKKELFPVVGPDGIARALFHYHLLELDAAGIEEICIIVQPGEDEMVRRYLRGPDDAYLKRLERYPALLREAEQMREFAGRVTFAVQARQEGYGHAVFQTKNLPTANSSCSTSATISSGASPFPPAANSRKWRRFPEDAACQR